MKESNDDHTHKMKESNDDLTQLEAWRRSWWSPPGGWRILWELSELGFGYDWGLYTGFTQVFPEYQQISVNRWLVAERLIWCWNSSVYIQKLHLVGRSPQNVIFSPDRRFKYRCWNILRTEFWMSSSGCSHIILVDFLVLSIAAVSYVDYMSLKYHKWVSHMRTYKNIYTYDPWTCRLWR